MATRKTTAIKNQSENPTPSRRLKKKATIVRIGRATVFKEINAFQKGLPTQTRKGKRKAYATTQVHEAKKQARSHA